jgi:hypothetical protein
MHRLRWSSHYILTFFIYGRVAPILTPSAEVSEVVGKHLPVNQALEAVVGKSLPPINSCKLRNCLCGNLLFKVARTGRKGDAFSAAFSKTPEQHCLHSPRINRATDNDSKLRRAKIDIYSGLPMLLSQGREELGGMICYFLLIHWYYPTVRTLPDLSHKTCSAQPSPPSYPLLDTQVPKVICEKVV